jgi:hypothetical protein
LADDERSHYSFRAVRPSARLSDLFWKMKEITLIREVTLIRQITTIRSIMIARERMTVGVITTIRRTTTPSEMTMMNGCELIERFHLI